MKLAIAVLVAATSVTGTTQPQITSVKAPTHALFVNSSVSATFEARVSGNPTAVRAIVGLEGFGKTTQQLTKVRAGLYRATVTLRPKTWGACSTVGYEIQALTANGTVSDRSFGGFMAQIKVAVTRFNAAPEPVRRGQRITVRGQFHEWGPSGARRSVFGEEKVQVLFRPATSTRYSTVATVRTDRRGEVAVPFVARTDGVWKLSFRDTAYPGECYSRTISHGDFVDVR